MEYKKFRDRFTEALERRRIQSRDFAHGNSTYNPPDLESRVDSPKNQIFIRHVGTSGIYPTAALYLSLAAAALGLNCTKSPSPTAPTGGKGTQVYSCQSIDGTSLGQATFEDITLGAPMAIKMDNLKSKGCATDGYDPQFMVSRAPPSGEQLEAFDANTSSGELRVTPTGNAKVVYLYPSGVNYSCALATGFGQGLSRGRYTTVRLLKGGETFPYDGVTVTDNPEKEFWITNGLKMINDAATVNGPNGTLKYGSLTWDRDNAAANLAGGLATIFPNPNNYAGYHRVTKFVIFTNVGMGDKLATAVLVGEAIESYLGKDNMCGTSTYASLFAPGNFSALSPTGITLVRFIMAFPP